LYGHEQEKQPDTDADKSTKKPVSPFIKPVDENPNENQRNKIKILIPGPMNSPGENVLETKLHRTNITKKNIPMVKVMSIIRTGMARLLPAFRQTWNRE